MYLFLPPASGVGQIPELEKRAVLIILECFLVLLFLFYQSLVSNMMSLIFGWIRYRSNFVYCWRMRPPCGLFKPPPRRLSEHWSIPLVPEPPGETLTTWYYFFLKLWQKILIPSQKWLLPWDTASVHQLVAGVSNSMLLTRKSVFEFESWF